MSTDLPPPMTSEEFMAVAGATPNQMRRLETYLTLLEEWRHYFNLVGPGSMADPWRRHILDSAQLVPLLPADKSVIADVGAGAGLPGLIVAILSERKVHLFESHGKKCRFLAEAAEATGAPVEIHNSRAEAAKGFKADIVLARAVAPLARLLGLVSPILRRDGICLFLKGQDAERELTAAAKTWKYEATVSKSLSDQHGKIVKLERISRRHV